MWSRNLSNEEGLSSAVVRNANVTPAAEFGRRGFVSRPRTVGLRFTDLTIPSGALIENAYIQFDVDETNSGETLLTIRGEASDSASSFT